MRTVDDLRQEISTEISPDELAAILESVLFRYSCYLLDDPHRGAGGHEDTNELYYLNYTKNVIKKL